MKHLNIYILLLALPCLALQCNKDDDDENNPKDVTRLSEEFKSYAYFKEGSWWVYKELNSGNLDSAYVTRSDILIEHLKDKHGGPEDYEHLSMNIVREFESLDNKDTLILEGTPVLPGSDKDDAYYNSKRIFTLSQTMFKYGVSQQLLLYIPADSIIEKNIESNPKVVWAKDSFKIKGRLYKDVFKMKHPERQGSETNNLIKSDIYAKNVGLIRREFWDGRLKELLRYNVEQ